MASILTNIKARDGKQSFDDYSELLDFIDRAPSKARRDQSHSTDMTDWSGTRTFEDALTLAQKGWPEGANKIRQLSADLQHLVETQIFRPEISFDVAGDILDVGRYVNGEPEDFMVWTESEDRLNHPQSKIVHIVASISVSSGIPIGIIYQRGAAVAALCDLLESAGKRVQLTVVAAMRDYAETRITIKNPDMPLQLDLLAFVLAHASSLRRMIFAAWERLPDRARRPVDNGDYGHPGEATERGDIYIGAATYGETQWHSEAAAVAWIKDQLSAYGVIES